MAIEMIFKIFKGILVQTVQADDKETAVLHIKQHCTVLTHSVKWTKGQTKASASVDAQMLMQNEGKKWHICSTESYINQSLHML